MLQEDEQPYFSYSEMRKSDNRRLEIPGFYRIIEENVSASIFIRYNKMDLEKAKARLWVPNWEIDFGHLNNPYLFAWQAFMDMFHLRQGEFDELVPLGSKIIFVYDDRSDSKHIINAWADYVGSKSAAVQDRFPETPLFLNEKEFVPLQAADFCAGWVRSCFEKSNPYSVLKELSYEQLEPSREVPMLCLELSHEQIFESIISITRNIVGRNAIIYDMDTLLMVGSLPSYQNQAGKVK